MALPIVEIIGIVDNNGVATAHDMATPEGSPMAGAFGMAGMTEWAVLPRAARSFRLKWVI